VWLLLAVEFGNSRAQSGISAAESELGTAQIDGAKKRALEMRERISAAKRSACANWDGQYAELPMGPPLADQIACERKATGSHD
jgi:hypothetical protein